MGQSSRLPPPPSKLRWPGGAEDLQGSLHAAQHLRAAAVEEGVLGVANLVFQVGANLPVGLRKQHSGHIGCTLWGQLSLGAGVPRDPNHNEALAEILNEIAARACEFSLEPLTGATPRLRHEVQQRLGIGGQVQRLHIVQAKPVDVAVESTRLVLQSRGALRRQGKSEEERHYRQRAAGGAAASGHFESDASDGSLRYGRACGGATTLPSCRH
mmetsp:Transcript_29517/g.83263  ORF Transcript_29517/g.83263 Transcript_29517/m.83263 type:complete len:213 (-) Transcript_29517:19-657(-)